ncbi:pseudouridine family [Moniliophthora roreri MCA 2997]|uniref:21S rRNA pseudouridine(2819) synthase n=1 Tax=Moniliophthora roreri (strain MCA 2997) TaxID=1381753 RepID=V2XBZ4_MONRO|nr:pseudouridine family [Moniliophthora roreri MCA 2997]
MSSFRVIFRQSCKGDNISCHLTYSRVLYVDGRMVVINKQAGVVAQFGHSKSQGEGHVKLLELEQETNNPPVKSQVLYPVHRLDKGTTGCLALARSRDMARELSRQFKQHTVEKTYYALVRGGESSFSAQQGTIDNPVEVSTNGRASLGTLSGDKKSRTRWELLGSSPSLPVSLLRLRLFTGHKHQLRVHMSKVLKTPILGDSIHSETKPKKEIRALLQSLSIPEDRLFLHSSHLGVIRYAKNGRQFRLGIQAPLPHDFVQFCNHSGLELDSDIAKPIAFIDGEPSPGSEIHELNGHLSELH